MSAKFDNIYKKHHTYFVVNLKYRSWKTSLLCFHLDHIHFLICQSTNCRWLVLNVASFTGEVYTLTPGRPHTVSRKTGDIILANDQSVSRRHAYLEVLSPMSVSYSIGYMLGKCQRICIIIHFDSFQKGVSVWDESSKYGTFVNDGIPNDRKIPAGSKETITEGAKVRFGLQEMNIWTSVFFNFVSIWLFNC